MKEKYFFPIFFIFAILVILLGSLFFVQKFVSSQITFKAPVLVNKNDHLPAKVLDQAVSGVAPHHLLAEELIDNFYRQFSSQTNPEVVVLLSPDHFNKALTADNPAFIVSESNNLIKKLAADNNFIFSDSFLASDHGLTAHLPFIKKYFPKATVIQILVPQKTSEAEIKKLTESIYKNFNQTIVIASVDFSHYLPESVADFHDLKAERTINNLDFDNYYQLEVDCWQCLYASSYYAKLKQKPGYQLIGHKNSTDYTDFDSEEGTTSYLSLIYNAESKNKPIDNQTALFLGDMMLDRDVETLMKKNSFNYPFAKLSRFTQGVDFVVTNLEGPIVNDPPYTGATSLQFAFDSKNLITLKNNHFNLVSLANNHTLNMGQAGLKETKELLKQENINYIGEPNKCSSEFFDEGELLFLAFNKTYTNLCPDQQILDIIKQAEQTQADKFIVISIHWGVEYKDYHSVGQENLAWAMIDAGADLIIGHHSHVVQDVSVYKNKLIFYSLGNFIFDQYFSDKTEQGLAVGLEKQSDKVVFRLFPLASELSQPYLMTGESRQQFLDELAQKSIKDLEAEIKSGIIIINNN